MQFHHSPFTRFPVAANLEADGLFAWTTVRHEAEARLKHLIEPRGLGLLTGEGGCVTTVCHHVAANLRRSPQSAPPLFGRSAWRVSKVSPTCAGIQPTTRCWATWKTDPPATRNLTPLNKRGEEVRTK
jgi:hypothetical protein